MQFRVCIARMPGVTIDESSARLARALARSPADVEQVLLEVGVDANYLARALLEGDPQGALAAVSQRLGVTRRQLALAVLRSAGTGATSKPRRVPRALMLAALGAVIAACAFAALAVAYVLSPSLFVETLLAGAAVLSAFAALALFALAWRLVRAARRARGR